MEAAEVEAIARRVAAQEARGVFAEEIASVVSDWKNADARAWNAIGQLQTIAARLETIAEYQEKEQRDTREAQARVSERVSDLRLEWAREAGKMGALGGVISSVIVAVIIQLIVHGGLP